MPPRAQISALQGSRDKDGAEGLVKEWGLSGSTLEEVFLRLAVQNRDVNAEIDILPPAAAESAAAAGRRMCVLCNAAPPSVVTLYTSKGVAVVAPDLICAACADADPRAPVVADAVAGAAVLVEMSRMHSFERAAAAGAVGGPDAPTSLRAAAALPAQPTYPAAIGGGGGGSSASAGYGAVGGSHGGGPPATNRAPRPDVSRIGHVAAIMRLRLMLQQKQRKTNACYAILIVVAVLITWLVTPSSSSVGSFCPGGYLEHQWGDAVRSGMCMMCDMT